MRNSQRSKRFLRSRILLLWYLSFLGLSALNAQDGTEIYLLTLSDNGDSLSLGEAVNISQNPGYDNQPFFPDDHRLLYARSRNGQTDIAVLDLRTQELSWASDTPGGSEYSPAPVPGKAEYSAVRLDTSGLQRLYAYGENGKSQVLVPDEKVGYYLWIDASTLACTVLEADRMDLVIPDLEADRVYKYQKGVGRCLQRIPGSDRFSYTTFREGQWLLKNMDPNSGATSEITRMPTGVQDYCWLPDGSLLCASLGKIYQLKPRSDKAWKVIHTLPSGIIGVSRLAVNPSGTRLALVAEEIDTP